MFSCEPQECRQPLEVGIRKQSHSHRRDGHLSIIQTQIPVSARAMYWFICLYHKNYWTYVLNNNTIVLEILLPLKYVLHNIEKLLCPGETVVNAKQLQDCKYFAQFLHYSTNTNVGLLFASPCFKNYSTHVKIQT